MLRCRMLQSEILTTQTHLYREQWIPLSCSASSSSASMKRDISETPLPALQDKPILISKSSSLMGTARTRPRRSGSPIASDSRDSRSVKHEGEVYPSSAMREPGKQREITSISLTQMFPWMKNSLNAHPGKWRKDSSKSRAYTCSQAEETPL